MNISESAADYLAKAIRRHHPEAASEEVLKYALIIVLNTLATIFTVLLVCAFTGHFIQGVTVLFAFALLRYFSGGVHLNSSVSCTIVSSAVLLFIIHIDFDYWYSGFVLDLLSIVITGLMAPSGMEKVSRIDPKYYPVLKIVSILIISSNLLFHSSLLSAAFFIQALSLTKPAHRLVHLLERRGYT